MRQHRGENKDNFRKEGTIIYSSLLEEVSICVGAANAASSVTLCVKAIAIEKGSTIRNSGLSCKNSAIAR